MTPTLMVKWEHTYTRTHLHTWALPEGWDGVIPSTFALVSVIRMFLQSRASSETHLLGTRWNHYREICIRIKIYELKYSMLKENLLISFTAPSFLVSALIEHHQHLLVVLLPAFPVELLFLVDTVMSLWMLAPSPGLDDVIGPVIVKDWLGVVNRTPVWFDHFRLVKDQQPLSRWAPFNLWPLWRTNPQKPVCVWHHKQRDVLACQRPLQLNLITWLWIRMLLLIPLYIYPPFPACVPEEDLLLIKMTLTTLKEAGLSEWTCSSCVFMLLMGRFALRFQTRCHLFSQKKLFNRKKT